MSIYALVPVKPFHDSKTRLASVLTPHEREVFSRESLDRTLTILRQVPLLAQVLVISRDPAALELARCCGARPLSEHGLPQLNNALQEAARAAVECGAGAVLVLPADLPLLCTEDLRALLALDDGRPGIVCVPDRRGDGTNALLWRPAELAQFAYGPGSFRKHQAFARQCGIACRTCRAPGIELDVDWPDDLDLYRKLAQSGSVPEPSRTCRDRRWMPGMVRA